MMKHPAAVAHPGEGRRPDPGGGCRAWGPSDGPSTSAMPHHRRSGDPPAVRCVRSRAELVERTPHLAGPDLIDRAGPCCVLGRAGASDPLRHRSDQPRRPHGHPHRAPRLHHRAALRVGAARPRGGHGVDGTHRLVRLRPGLWVCLLAATTAPSLRLWARCRSRSTTPRDGTATPGHRLVPLDRERARSRARRWSPPFDWLTSGSLISTSTLVPLLATRSSTAVRRRIDRGGGSCRGVPPAHPRRDRPPRLRGLDRWLGSSPRAAGNPLPYLQRPTRSPSLPDSRERHESHGTP